jgi:lipopolysaccharide exporter
MTLFTGSTVAQIISIASLILLQRFFYSPEEYAPFRLFFEYVAIFSSISALRLESGLILEREEDKAISLLRVCIKLCFVMSLIGGLIFCLFYFKEIDVFQRESILLILMPFAILTNGLIQIFLPFFTRAKSFLTISYSKIIHSVISSFSQIITGLIGLNFIGLILGRIAGLFSADLNYLKTFYSKFKWNQRNKEVEICLIQKHKKFIYFTSPGIFIGNSINFIILITFTTLYGEKFTGLTAAAIQYLGLVVMLFASSFSQVYYNEIAQIKNPKELYQSYTFWVKRLFILTSIGWFLLMICPSWIVTSVLGEKWVGLMNVIKIISPWMAVMFIASSMSFIFIRLGKQREILFFDIFHLVLILVALIFGHYYLNDKIQMLYAITGAQTLFYILSISLAYSFLINNQKKDDIISK